LAEIAPFRGIRYNVGAVHLNDVTSPPYDVISPADREYFHRRHPKNVVRLILGQELPEDSAADNRFTRAAAYLEEWIAEGTLVRDPKPALYVHEQHYRLRGAARTVRGFAALARLHNCADGVILPHENTLAKPKSDLVRLIRATKANLDSVYAVHPDPEHVVDAVLDRVAATSPAGEATDRDGVRHRLWRMEDQAQIGAIVLAMAGRQLVIADGHHRYEASLAYRDEMREREGDPHGDRPYDYIMMTLVNAYSPGVAALPTHRVVRGLPLHAARDMDSRLAEQFDLVGSSRESVLIDMEEYGGRAVGIYRAGRAYIAIPKPGSTSAIPGPPALQALDVSVLHELILGRILGVDAERLRLEENVSYTRDEREAIEAVDRGEAQLAFFLNPIKLEAVLEVAQRGQRMPQKATYFYPKLLSGLVMRRIE